MKALIRFKNYFYFEERDDPVEEMEKVRYPLTFHDVIMTSSCSLFGHCLEARYAACTRRFKP